VDWSRGAHRESGGQVLVEGEPLAPGKAERHLELAAVCRLCTRAANWRARLLAGDDSSSDEREELVREASNAGTFLWTLLQDGNLSDNPADFQRLADVYLACAVALEAWQGFPLQRAGELMLLIAEAQWGKSERRKAKNPPGRVFPNSCWKGFSGGPGSQRVFNRGGLQRNHLRRRRAFLALLNGEFHLLTFSQTLKASGLDSREVYKHVLAAISRGSK